MRISNVGSFTMKDGSTIANNMDGYAGVGVAVQGESLATMQGGQIIHNHVTGASVGSLGGGGVFIRDSNSTFTKNGGSITNNTIADGLNGENVYKKTTFFTKTVLYY